MGNIYSYLRPAQGDIADPETEVIKTPIFNRDEVLQAPCNVLEYALTRYAFEFAVLGYLDDAKDLVSLLNNYSFYHGQTVVLRPLWLAWAEIDSWPDKEHERVNISIGELAKQFSSLFFDGRYIWGKTGLGFSNDAKVLIRLLKAVDEMNPMFAGMITGGFAAQRSEALARALDLRLALAAHDSTVVSASGTAEEAALHLEDIPTVEDILGRIAARIHCISQIKDLAQSARAWKILKNGALAKAIGVQDIKVAQLAREVKDAFSDRFKNGRQIPAAGPMNLLIRAISDNTESSAGAEMIRNEDGTPEPPEPLIHPGATAEQIAELEERLGVTLPDDYKEFLSLSNGLGSSWGGMVWEPSLHSVNDVRWEVDEDYNTDFILEILPFGVFPTCRDFPGLAKFDEWPRAGRTIHIGAMDLDVVWLIPPATVARVRDAYLGIHDSERTPARLKATIMNAVNSFAGSRQGFEELGWCVLQLMGGDGDSGKAYPSFKEYLADRARKSGTDYWAGEERDKRCFAFTCR